MQIGSLNHLIFLPGSAPAGSANADDANAADASGSAAAATDASKALAPQLTEHDAAGVVLDIQSLASTPSTALPQDLVYSNTLKTAATDAGASGDADTAAMALRHSQALERSAGSPSALSVDSNGVLLAKPVSPAEARAQAFVHHAVTAMRDYADAQARQKAADKAADPSTDSAPASIIPRSLADVQKLAARFKLFA